MKRRWINHERKMEAMTYASQIDLKKVMAGLMNVGFVALPIFYDPKKNELNLEQPKLMKQSLEKYYNHIKTLQVKGENATLSQQKDEVLKDFRSKLDPRLSQDLLKIGLQASGVPNADALAQLGRQVIESGAITDPSKISRAVDKSTETLAAQLMLNAMLNKKEPEPTQNDKLVKLFEQLQQQPTS